jgi:hypothetical protein
MGKVTIYMSLINGVLNYRDSEKDKGTTIKTSVDPGDKIIWTLDKNSGISDISGINIIGSSDFLSKGPDKKSVEKWTSKVSKKATGEIAYDIFVTAQNKEYKKSLPVEKNAKSVDNDPPKIKVRL